MKNWSELLFSVLFVAFTIFYFISVNAYSGIYLGIVIFSLFCVVVIFFSDNNQIIKKL